MTYLALSARKYMLSTYARIFRFRALSALLCSLNEVVSRSKLDWMDDCLMKVVLGGYAATAPGFEGGLKAAN